MLLLLLLLLAFRVVWRSDPQGARQRGRFATTAIVEDGTSCCFCVCRASARWEHRPASVAQDADRAAGNELQTGRWDYSAATGKVHWHLSPKGFDHRHRKQSGEPPTNHGGTLGEDRRSAGIGKPRKRIGVDSTPSPGPSLPPLPTTIPKKLMVSSGIGVASAVATTRRTPPSNMFPAPLPTTRRRLRPHRRLRM